MLITSAGLRILEAPDRKVTYNLHRYLQLPDCMEQICRQTLPSWKFLFSPMKTLHASTSLSLYCHRMTPALHCSGHWQSASEVVPFLLFHVASSNPNLISGKPKRGLGLLCPHSLVIILSLLPHLLPFSDAHPSETVIHLVCYRLNGCQ